MEACKSCGKPRSPKVPICPHCGASKESADQLLAAGLKGLENLRYEESLSLFNRAFRLDAKCHAAMVGKSQAHLALGQFDQAIDCLDTALRLQPRDARLKNMRLAAVESRTLNEARRPGVAMPSRPVGPPAARLDHTALADDWAKLHFDSPFALGLGDYTPASLAALDIWFDELYPAPKTGDAKPQQLELVVRIGSYLGEVLRRRWNGHWQDDPDDKHPPLMTRVAFPNGMTCRPIELIMKRFASGKDFSIEAFFHALRQQVAPKDNGHGDPKDWIAQADSIPEVRPELAAKLRDRAHPNQGAAASPHADLATKCAEAQAQLLRQHANLPADYSAASVAALDAFLDATIGTNGVPNPDGFQPNPQQLNTVAGIGCYVGEVLRRLHGGHWDAETLTGNPLPFSLIVTPENSPPVAPVLHSFKRLKYGRDRMYPWFQQQRALALGSPAEPTQALGDAEEAPAWVTFAKCMADNELIDVAVTFCDNALHLDAKCPGAAQLRGELTHHLKAAALPPGRPGPTLIELAAEGTEEDAKGIVYSASLVKQGHLTKEDIAVVSYFVQIPDDPRFNPGSIEQRADVISIRGAAYLFGEVTDDRLECFGACVVSGRLSGVVFAREGEPAASAVERVEGINRRLERAKVAGRVKLVELAPSE